MKEYVRSIRAMVGHAPIMLVGASVIAVNACGEVLLQRRKDNGKWGYAGGSVELYEAVEDAARRELYEETGLVAGKLTLFRVFSGPELGYTYPNGDRVSIVDIVHVCEDYSGELRPQEDEVAELRFFPIDALPDDEEISPPVRPALKALAAAQGGAPGAV